MFDHFICPKNGQSIGFNDWEITNVIVDYWWWVADAKIWITWLLYLALPSVINIEALWDWKYYRILKAEKSWDTLKLEVSQIPYIE